MHLLVLILTRGNGINELLRELAEQGISGCTIVNTTGMKSIIENYEDLPMFGMLRHIMEEEDKEENKMLLFVLKDDEISKTKRTIHSILGDFNSPNTGIMFTLPIDSADGIGGSDAFK